MWLYIATICNTAPLNNKGDIKMPEYNYVCPDCGYKFAVNKKISEYNPHEPCPNCNQSTNRDMTVNYCNGNYIVNTDGFYGKTSY